MAPSELDIYRHPQRSHNRRFLADRAKHAAPKGDCRALRDGARVSLVIAPPPTATALITSRYRWLNSALIKRAELETGWPLELEPFEISLPPLPSLQ